MLKVWVGISANNEAVNIASLLESLVGQTQKEFKLEKIVVVSDGSTDETVGEARKVKDKRILVVDEKVQQGQRKRQNQIMDMFTGDVLVLMDGDVMPENKKVLGKIIKVFAQNKSLCLVGAHLVPKKGNTLLQKAYENLFNARYRMVGLGEDREKVWGFWGGCMAIRSKVVEKTRIPLDVPNDAYLYFYCRSNQLRVYHQKSARVFFTLPANKHDFVNQSLRYQTNTQTLSKYFDKDLIDSSYFVCGQRQIKQFWLQLRLNPVGYAYLKFLALKVLALQKVKQVNTSIWKPVCSTKDLLINHS